MSLSIRSILSFVATTRNYATPKNLAIITVVAAVSAYVVSSYFSKKKPPSQEITKLAVIPAKNKDTFQLRESSRRSIDRKTSYIGLMLLVLRSSIRGALMRSNVSLFSAMGINAFQHCMGFLDISDLASSCRVAKNWHTWINDPQGQLLWENASIRASIREGVPIVQGNSRNHKEDFKFLRPITISGKIISRYLGEVVGEVPLMRQDRFDELRHARDVFDPARYQRETHVVLVDPSALRITVSPHRPLAMDAGTLVEVPNEERATIAAQELTVPFSFKNLRMLATYPLAGIEHRPVFTYYSWLDVFDHWCDPPDQNRLLIMRVEVVARHRTFDGVHGQNAEVTNRGFTIVTLRQRGFFDAIKILKTGTCPDNRAPLTLARSAERGLPGGYPGYATIGGFVPGDGVHVRINEDDDDDDNNDAIGVVPGVSAEVPQALGT